MQIHARAFYILEHFCKAASIDVDAIDKWVWLVRKDKYAQAISKIRARETGLWAMYPDRPDESELNQSPVEFDTPRVYEEACLMFFEDQMWETFFEAHHKSPYKVYYEHLADESQWEHIIADILNFPRCPLFTSFDVEHSNSKASRQRKAVFVP